MTMVRVPMVNVTSTMLRAMVRAGQDITPFVPACVAADIVRNYARG